MLLLVAISCYRLDLSERMEIIFKKVVDGHEGLVYSVLTFVAYMSC